jgi:hypothetical protein
MARFPISQCEEAVSTRGFRAETTVFLPERNLTDRLRELVLKATALNAVLWE